MGKIWNILEPTGSNGSSMLRAQIKRCSRRAGFPSAAVAEQRRQFGLSRARLSGSIDVKEIDIPVPWGKIAARSWNYKIGTRPVLCVHGWKDNAATFDTLIPLLIKETPEYQFLSIDLPGHGLSSHFPIGMIYTLPDIFILYRRLLRHFGWTKFNILAHSMGAAFSLMFAGTHPDLVKKFIALDALSPIVQTKQDRLELIPNLTNAILKFEQNILSGDRPTYPYDDIVKKLMTAHVGKMKAEDVKILMSRGVEESPPGSGLYRFTHDVRVQFMPILSLSSRQVGYVMENFRSDILRIRADGGLKVTVPKYIEDNQKQWLAFDTTRKPKGNIVTFVTVPGHHHVHLSNPEVVLPYIVRFLKQEKFPVYDGSS